MIWTDGDEQIERRNRDRRAEEFERRISGELRRATDQIEPRLSLADLRAKIARRTRHMRRRRIRRAARSDPEPETRLMPSIAEQVWRGSLLPAGLGCWCGRPAIHTAQQTADMWRSCGDGVETVCAAYCCWRCQAARDGGWILAPWNPQDVWTDVHTWGCQLRFSQHSPAAEYLNAAWNAGSARPLRRKEPSHDSPVPEAGLPPRGPRPPADVRPGLAARAAAAPAGRERRLRPWARARHARADGRPDRRDQSRERAHSTLIDPPREDN